MGPQLVCKLGGLPGGRDGGTHFWLLLMEPWRNLDKATRTGKSFSGSTGMRWDVLHWSGSWAPAGPAERVPGLEGYQQGQPVPWTWRSGVGVQGHPPLWRQGGPLPQGGTALPGMAVGAGRTSFGEWVLGPQPQPLAGEGLSKSLEVPREILHRAPSSAAGVACSSTHGQEPHPLLGGPTSPRPLQSHLVSRQQGQCLVLPEAQSQGLTTSGREVPSPFPCRWKGCPHPIFLLLKLMAGSRPCESSPALLPGEVLDLQQTRAPRCSTACPVPPPCVC